MSGSIRAAGALVLALIGVTTAITAAQQVAPPAQKSSASPLAGRWELVVKPPAGDAGPPEISFMIVRSPGRT